MRQYVLKEILFGTQSRKRSKALSSPFELIRSLVLVGKNGKQEMQQLRGDE